MKHITNNKKNAGFTLVELVVVIAIICVLSGMILYTVSQYVNKGKDSNVFGSMAVLIPAGEVWYNANTNSYNGFCSPASNSVMMNSMVQMPENVSVDTTSCYNSNKVRSSWTSVSNLAGLCCFVSGTGQAWVSCTREFTDSTTFYCVDSRGMKEPVSNTVGSCTNAGLMVGGAAQYQCP